MRDDFTKSTKEILARRVGYKCSNPKCRKATIGPHSNISKAINVGVASHITAASQGGPRFDASLSDEERISVENGIWLCQMCAKLVDSDLKKYSKEVLLDWRETAEILASKEVVGTQNSVVPDAEAHSIIFRAFDWSLWRNRGNLPSDQVVVLDGWERGDIRYEGRIRLRNNLSHEESLHRFRIEFRNKSEILQFEEFSFGGSDLILLPGKWRIVDVHGGLRDHEMFARSQSIWCSAERVEDGEVLEWHVLEINHSSVTFSAG